MKYYTVIYLPNSGNPTEKDFEFYGQALCYSGDISEQIHNSNYKQSKRKDVIQIEEREVLVDDQENRYEIRKKIVSRNLLEDLE